MLGGFFVVVVGLFLSTRVTVGWCYGVGFLSTWDESALGCRWIWEAVVSSAGHTRTHAAFSQAPRPCPPSASPFPSCRYHWPALSTAPAWSLFSPPCRKRERCRLFRLVFVQAWLDSGEILGFLLFVVSCFFNGRVVLGFAHRSITWSYTDTHGDKIYHQGRMSHPLFFFFISPFSQCYNSRSLIFIYICIAKPGPTDY
jgi:hypothetical protein